MTAGALAGRSFAVGIRIVIIKSFVTFNATGIIAQIVRIAMISQLDIDLFVLFVIGIFLVSLLFVATGAEGNHADHHLFARILVGVVAIFTTLRVFGRDVCVVVEVLDHAPFVAFAPGWIIFRISEAHHFGHHLWLSAGPRWHLFVF